MVGLTVDEFSLVDLNYLEIIRDKMIKIEKNQSKQREGLTYI